MGQKDLTEKSLEYYPDVFADIINALLYRGKQIVSEEDLQSAPTETLYPDKHNRLHNQFHDVSKYLMQDGQIIMQYTLENETQARKKTVLRKAGYQGAIYRQQVNGKDTYPVISALLYWGKSHWRQPRSLTQLWHEKPIPDISKEFIDDIKLHVFDMCHLPQAIRNYFKSDIRIIVDYLAEKKNYIPTTQKIIHTEALLRMLKALTDDKGYAFLLQTLTLDQQKKGGTTMCELLDRYEKKGKAEDIRNLMDSMKWTAEQAMTALKIPDSEKSEYLALL